jgi:hypothetical protein
MVISRGIDDSRREMPYCIVHQNNYLVVDVDHRIGDDADSFYNENNNVIYRSKSIAFRIMEIDGDNVTIGYIQDLLSKGINITVSPLSERVKEVFKILDLKGVRIIYC